MTSAPCRTCSATSSSSPTCCSSTSATSSARRSSARSRPSCARSTRRPRWFARSTASSRRRRCSGRRDLTSERPESTRSGWSRRASTKAWIRVRSWNRGCLPLGARARAHARDGRVRHLVLRLHRAAALSPSPPPCGSRQPSARGRAGRAAAAQRLRMARHPQLAAGAHRPRRHPVHARPRAAVVGGDPARPVARRLGGGAAGGPGLLERGVWRPEERACLHRARARPRGGGEGARPLHADGRGDGGW